MKSFSFSEIPGFARAIADARDRQTKLREDAWFRTKFDACGFTLRLMNLQEYAVLERTGCPFLRRLEPTSEELAQFLWFLSPEFESWCRGFRLYLPDALRRLAAYRHGRRVRLAFCSDMPATSEAVVKRCFEYVELLFDDAPPIISKGRESGLCYLAAWFDELASEHHLTDERIWQMPLPELFQRLKAIAGRKNPERPAFNRAVDEVRGRILRGLTRKEFTVEDLKEGRVKFDADN